MEQLVNIAGNYIKGLTIANIFEGKKESVITYIIAASLHDSFQ